jgi:hypothetical protein
MKRNLFLFDTLKIGVFLLSFCMLNLTSCGDDETIQQEQEKEKNEENELENNLSEKAQKFVGCWYARVSAYDHYFTFFPNGKAIRDSQSKGVWTFNEDSDILATTIENWQFKITLSTNEAWAGHTLNTGRTVNASKRGDDLFVRDYLLITNWKNEEGNYSPLKLNSSQNITYSNIILKDKEITMDFKLSYIKNSLRLTTNGNIIISNIYEESPKMTINSSIIDSTYPFMKGEYIGYFY